MNKKHDYGRLLAFVLLLMISGSLALAQEQRSGGANEYIYDNFDKKLADLFAAKPKLFWIGIGNTDFLFKDNTAFREKLTKNHYPFTYMETDGGHIWRNWRIYLGEFAQKIFK